MTPAQHYKEAERLIGEAAHSTDKYVLRRDVLLIAQIHATLATFRPSPDKDGYTEHPYREEDSGDS